MFRNLVQAFSLAAGAALLAAFVAALAASPAAAGHHHRAHFHACVAAEHGAWLYRCRGYRCWKPVRYGRAFRVLRQEGGYLLVSNISTRGWIELNSLRLVPQDYCRAAGI